MIATYTHLLNRNEQEFARGFADLDSSDRVFAKLVHQAFVMQGNAVIFRDAVKSRFGEAGLEYFTKPLEGEGVHVRVLGCTSEELERISSPEWNVEETNDSAEVKLNAFLSPFKFVKRDGQWLVDPKSLIAPGADPSAVLTFLIKFDRAIRQGRENVLSGKMSLKEVDQQIFEHAFGQ